MDYHPKDALSDDDLTTALELARIAIDKFGPELDKETELGLMFLRELGLNLAKALEPVYGKPKKLDPQSFNAFGQLGTVTVNPRLVVWLVGHEDEKFGLLDSNVPINEAIEWMAMAVIGIHFREVKRFCREHKIKIAVKFRQPNGGYGSLVDVFQYDEANTPGGIDEPRTD